MEKSSPIKMEQSKRVNKTDLQVDFFLNLRTSSNTTSKNAPGLQNVSSFPRSSICFHVTQASEHFTITRAQLPSV